MRFTIRTSMICVAALALMFAAGLPYLRRINQPQQCSYVMAADSTLDSFPTTNGYSILDSNGDVRFVALHRLSHRPTGRTGKPSWLDVRLDARRRPHVSINGEFVALGGTIILYYAVDDRVPQLQVLPGGAIRAYEFPHAVWDRIILTDTADEP